MAIRLLQVLPRSTIEVLLYEHEVLSDVVYGNSKESMLLNVFRGLEQLGRTDLLVKILEGALKILPPEPRGELEGALIRDGYVSTGEQLVSGSAGAVEHRSALQVMIEQHSGILKTGILLHHLLEAEDQFRLEKWDSCISQTRKLVEQILFDIAEATAKRRGENVDLGKPVKVRDYLQGCGFFDESERKKLVDGVYGYFSDEGAHPGISTQSAARVCLSILWTFGFYLLEKFQDWRVRAID